MTAKNNFLLTNKVAVITGGASGIGHSIAKAYADKGAKVVLLDIKEDVVDIALAISKDALGIKVDITQKSRIEDAKQQILAKYEKVDLLVNCAGVALLDKAEDLSEEAWDKSIDLNLKGSFLTSQVFGNEMIVNEGGKIINMASQGAVVALDKHVAYNSTKAAIVMMTKVMAMEWAKYNIQVNAISPTVVMTELGKKAWAGEVGENMKRLIPAGRFGYPEEVGSVAVFLASEEASLITGENVVIDGGYTIK